MGRLLHAIDTAIASRRRERIAAPASASGVETRSRTTIAEGSKLR